MMGILVWGIIVIVNIFVFTAFNHPKTWDHVGVGKILLSAFTSMLIIFTIFIAIEHKYASEYIMWLPVAILFGTTFNCLIIVVTKSLYIALRRKVIQKDKGKSQSINTFQEYSIEEKLQCRKCGGELIFERRPKYNQILAWIFIIGGLLLIITLPLFFLGLYAVSAKENILKCENCGSCYIRKR